MTLGERLLEYRTNLKISQDTLAEKIGVTRQTISKWETDQSTPEFNKIMPLCEIFGITPDELISGEKVEKKEHEVKEEKSDNVYDYNEKRNQKKAIVVSTAVFLYIMGTFIPAIMELSLGGDSAQSIGWMALCWAIATCMLIYFFISNPKIQVENLQKEEKQEKSVDSTLEKRIISIIALFFLLIYILVSFATMEWRITWVLWIVCVIVQTIVKLIFDLRRRNSSEK